VPQRAVDQAGAGEGSFLGRNRALLLASVVMAPLLVVLLVMLDRSATRADASWQVKSLSWQPCRATLSLEGSRWSAMPPRP
jgi:hypothetical protein